MTAVQPLASRQRPASGFTLIEMMITVALSSLVGVLIYTVFIEQTRAYRMQADMGTMQQNLRIGMELLTRDVANAGYGTAVDGGAWGVDGQDGTADSPIFAMRIRNAYPFARADAIELLMMDPDRANWVYTSSDVSILCGTTEIALSGHDVPFADTFSDTSENDRIMCFSSIGLGGKPHSYIWDVSGTGDTSTGLIPVDANGQTDFSNECANALPKFMICGPVVWVAYYVDDESADGIGIGSGAVPVLYLVPDVAEVLAAGGYPAPDDIPVALGIEDLQFSYCEAGSGIDCELDASWLGTGYDLDPSLSGANVWQNLSAVRVMMTARTLRPDLERSSVSQPIDLVADDGPAPFAGPDAYHRRVARTEVSIRNAIGTWQVMHQPF